jgi:flagellin
MVSGFGIPANLGAAQTALRTLDAARERSQKAEAQIATGREVNSARDDGGRFAMAQQAKADAAAMTVVARRQTDLAGRFGIGLAAVERRDTILRQLADLALRASDDQLSATERATLENEANRIVAIEQSSNASSSALAETRVESAFPGAVWAPLFAGSPNIHEVRYLNGTNGQQALFAPDNTTGNDPWFANFGTQATALANLGQYRQAADAAVRRGAEIGRQMKTFEANADRLEAGADALTAAAGRLVDADMAQVSADREAARVQTDTAIAGLTRAIAIYGRYNTSLLGQAETMGGRLRAQA